MLSLIRVEPGANNGYSVSLSIAARSAESVRISAPIVQAVHERHLMLTLMRNGDTQAQFERIEHCLPTQRGNVGLPNLSALNTVLYAAEHGCKWSGLTKRLGNWRAIHTRMNRWSKAGVLDRVFEELPRAQVVRIKIEACRCAARASRCNRMDWREKSCKALANPEADGTPRFMRLPWMCERRSSWPAIATRSQPVNEGRLRLWRGGPLLYALCVYACRCAVVMQDLRCPRRFAARFFIALGQTLLSSIEKIIDD